MAGHDIEAVTVFFHKINSGHELVFCATDMGPEGFRGPTLWIDPDFLQSPFDLA